MMTTKTSEYTDDQKKRLAAFDEQSALLDEIEKENLSVEDQEALYELRREQLGRVADIKDANAARVMNKLSEKWRQDEDETRDDDWRTNPDSQPDQ